MPFPAILSLAKRWRGVSSVRPYSCIEGLSTLSCPILPYTKPAALTESSGNTNTHLIPANHKTDTLTSGRLSGSVCTYKLKSLNKLNLLNGKFHYLKEPLFFWGVGDYYVSYYLICKHAVRVGLWMEMKVC